MIWAIAAPLFALVLMVDRPVIVSVSVPEPVRQAQAVLLRMEGVTMKRDAPANWNVFWELPKADAQTLVENMHFVGSIHSPANTSLRDPRPANFVLTMPPGAIALLRKQSQIHFTFVPIGKLPEGGVTITSIRLE